MTPARLVECLEILRWPTETLAEALGCDEGLVEAWVFGIEEVPMKAGAWIEALTRSACSGGAVEAYGVEGTEG